VCVALAVLKPFHFDRCAFAESSRVFLFQTIYPVLAIKGALPQSPTRLIAASDRHYVSPHAV